MEGGSEEGTEGCNPSFPAECPTDQVAKTTGVAADGPLHGGRENASTLVLTFKKLEGEEDNLKRKVQTKQSGMDHGTMPRPQSASVSPTQKTTLKKARQRASRLLPPSTNHRKRRASPKGRNLQGGPSDLREEPFLTEEDPLEAVI